MLVEGLGSMPLGLKKTHTHTCRKTDKKQTKSEKRIDALQQLLKEIATRHDGEREGIAHVMVCDDHDRFPQLADSQSRVPPFNLLKNI